jgi:hypothetical protein
MPNRRKDPSAVYETRWRDLITLVAASSSNLSSPICAATWLINRFASPQSVVPMHLEGVPLAATVRSAFAVRHVMESAAAFLLNEATNCALTSVFN